MNYRVAASTLLMVGMVVVGAGCKEEYPVEFRICDVDFTGCFTVAKFKDKEDCATTEEKWSWYCDKTDQKNIRCHTERSTISTSYCSDSK
jgi:hypothetical protein